MAHFFVQLGERGRIVLPAPVRRALHLGPGSRLLVEVEGESVKLTDTAVVAARGRGLFRDDSGRDRAAELIAERREEARRED